MNRVAKNSELKGAHFEIFQGFSSNFAKNVRFLYYREANKKRHVPLKVAPMCSKVHGFSHPGSSWFSFSTTGHGVARKSDLSIFPPNECWLFSAEKGDKRSSQQWYWTLWNLSRKLSVLRICRLADAMSWWEPAEPASCAQIMPAWTPGFYKNPLVKSLPFSWDIQHWV